MKEHKYNNTVIQSNGGEHGKKIIEFWKEQGVDTPRGFEGSVSRWYYGLIDGVFCVYDFQEVKKASATIIELPESKLQDLIGRKVRGFNFEDKGNHLWYIKMMDDYIGKVGEIYRTGINYCAVEFEHVCWNYPTSLIHEHLVEDDNNVDTSEQNVDTSPQIIDLSNVEGVEMIVSDDEKSWYKEIVIAKYADTFIDCNCGTWRSAKPIEVKKVTMKQIEEKFGCKVEIVKED